MNDAWLDKVNRLRGIGIETVAQFQCTKIANRKEDIRAEIMKRISLVEGTCK
jgi:hypothetical protein